jgi:ribosomal-protein-alanine N-acetyltransferase
MNQILLETPRLVLRRIEQDDYLLLQSIFCDSEVMKYLGDVWTPDQVHETLDEWHDQWGKAYYFYGVLQKKDTLEAVGIAGCSLDTIQDEPGLEISWFVLPRYQGNGYAQEITSALVSLAFGEFEVSRVLAETHPQNVAANKVLEITGFVCLGERNHQYDFLPAFTNQSLWEKKKDF